MNDEPEGKEWPTCFCCKGTHVVPGGFAEPAGVLTFVVDAGIANRASFFQANHKVELEELAWLCLDCGVAWQSTRSESMESMKETLREKCRPEFRARLFGDPESDS